MAPQPRDADIEELFVQAGVPRSKTTHWLSTEELRVHLQLRRTRQRLRAVHVRVEELRLAAGADTALPRALHAAMETAVQERRVAMMDARRLSRLRRSAWRRRYAAAVAAARVHGAPLLAAELVSRLSRARDNWRTRTPVYRSNEDRVADLERWAPELRTRFQPPNPPAVPQQPAAANAESSRAPVRADHGLEGPISVDELREAARGLKGGSVGTGIPVYLLKTLVLSSDDIAEWIAAFLSDVYTGVVSIPDAFTLVTISPVLKPGKDARDLGSFRTLAYGDTLSRLLQAVVTTRLQRHIRATGCLHQSQGGFIAGCSVEMVAWLAARAAEKCRLGGQPLYRMFVDVSRAFGSCHHRHVLRAMEAAGITGTCWKFMQRWLAQMQVTMVDGVAQLTPLDVWRGVMEAGYGPRCCGTSS